MITVAGVAGAGEKDMVFEGAGVLLLAVIMTGLGVGNEELFSIVVQVDGGRGGLLWFERECDPLLELGPGQTA
jgi:hypothetical protein